MLVELEMVLVIFACCVLHNFILLQESDTEPEVDTFDQIDICPRGSWKWSGPPRSRGEVACYRPGTVDK
ncbi:hypothetical protein DPMN_192596 [Dreissena polymorpha]|uniref:Uncharacterized protein n=1 Tax=Dreissena polymorpha TaxID=45954 RepID=A0A9D3Y7I9_DREPO|nr:hypothetical protein DPMN_192596 [Dreissena polymorpha]